MKLADMEVRRTVDTLQLVTIARSIAMVTVQLDHFTWLAVALFVSNFTFQMQAKEVCSTEEFVAKCERNHVILITSGQYGRMRIGRCVHVDFGFVGCFTDVIDILDRHCSGRVECQLKIPDPEMDETKPCLADLTRYLDATYDCVPEIQVNSGSSCPMLVDLARTVYSSATSMTLTRLQRRSTNQCSSVLFTVLSGHRINVTLFDFTSSENRNYVTAQRDVIELVSEDSNATKLRLPNSSPPGCYNRYALVKDFTASATVDICSSTSRVSTAYTSTGHALEVKIFQQRTINESPLFLLKYEVMGCPRITLPSYYWVKTTNNTSVVGCLISGDIWRLRCVNNSWMGHVGNCTREDTYAMNSIQFPLLPKSQSNASSVTVEKALFLPLGLTVMIIVVLASTIGIVITVMGLYVIKKYHLIDSTSSSITDQVRCHPSISFITGNENNANMAIDKSVSVATTHRVVLSNNSDACRRFASASSCGCFPDDVIMRSVDELPFGAVESALMKSFVGSAPTKRRPPRVEYCHVTDDVIAFSSSRCSCSIVSDDNSPRPPYWKRPQYLS